MKYEIKNFKGMLPSVADRSLPDGMASFAQNTNLFDSNLKGFQNNTNYLTLPKPAPINTIYRYPDSAQSALPANGGPIVTSQYTYPANFSLAQLYSGGREAIVPIYHYTDPTKVGAYFPSGANPGFTTFGGQSITGMSPTATQGLFVAFSNFGTGYIYAFDDAANKYFVLTFTASLGSTATSFTQTTALATQGNVSYADVCIYNGLLLGLYVQAAGTAKIDVYQINASTGALTYLSTTTITDPAILPYSDPSVPFYKLHPNRYVNENGGQVLFAAYRDSDKSLLASYLVGVSGTTLTVQSVTGITYPVIGALVTTSTIGTSGAINHIGTGTPFVAANVVTFNPANTYLLFGTTFIKMNVTAASAPVYSQYVTALNSIVAPIGLSGGIGYLFSSGAQFGVWWWTYDTNAGTLSPQNFLVLEAIPGMGQVYSASASSTFVVGGAKAAYNVSLGSVSPSPPYWLSWRDAEVPAGYDNVDVAVATSGENTTYLSVLTGAPITPPDVSLPLYPTTYPTMPGFTDIYHAVHPDNKLSSPTGAYPYVVFPLSAPSPSLQDPPTATATNVSSPTTALQVLIPQATINNVTVSAGGTGYSIGDVLSLSSPTPLAGLPGAAITVTTVDANGAITGISLTNGGFYAFNTASGTASASGGTGSGASFSYTMQNMNATGVYTSTYDNGAGSYIHWSVGSTYSPIELLCSTGQGDLSYATQTAALSLKTAASFTYQVDWKVNDNGGGEFPDTVFYLASQQTSNIRNLTGPAILVSKANSLMYLYTTLSGGTNDDSVPPGAALSTAVTIAGGTIYRLIVSGTQQTNSSSPGFSITAKLYDTSNLSTPIATLSGFIPYNGEQFGIGTNHRGSHNNANVASFYNWYVTTTQPTNTLTGEATNYVYTYVYMYGADPFAYVFESGPSPPSQSVLAVVDQTGTKISPINVQIVPPLFSHDASLPEASVLFNVIAVNLYRLVNVSGQEIYELVATIPAINQFSYISYTDTALDSALGAPLSTTNFLPPPKNLNGVIALPNGVLAGFHANSLYLSAPNTPYAWPLTNQYNTDDPIVGIASIDTTVLILTRGHPYTAFGSDPSRYSMSKETAIQGCISKRSIATHKRYGVLYASSNGPAYYRGQGDLDLLRSQIGVPYFTYDQWQSYVNAAYPLRAGRNSPLLGIVKDDNYYLTPLRMTGF